jgi:hypothetical protein
MLKQPDSWHTSSNYPINRLHAYPVTTATMLTETNSIKHPTKQLTQYIQTSNSSQNKHNTVQNRETHEMKWKTFTYMEEKQDKSQTI